MKKCRIGVVGCGSIARHRHLPEYALQENVEIVAVCDIVQERAEEMAKKYQAKAYTDFNDLLSDPEIDAVSVCTPNAWHAPISIAALEAGKHVLCEKPMATSSEEAQAMIEACEKSGKKLMIAHNQRFVASHQKAKHLIETGRLGKIYSFRTTFGHGGPEGWSVDGKNSWFFKKEQAFIGAMGDLGIHKADLIRYLLGEEITEVGAFVETKAKSFADVDDNAVCILKTESGIIGTLTASWSYVSREDNSTMIYGEKGILRLEDDASYSFIMYQADGETIQEQIGKIQSNDDGGQTTSHVIEAFVGSIMNDTEVPVPGIEGKKSLEVILAALEASVNSQIVKVGTH
jgi:UDP-N-acetylglucosamine 3-dehydrogenase